LRERERGERVEHSKKGRGKCGMEGRKGEVYIDYM